jgi:hypothetical protein
MSPKIDWSKECIHIYELCGLDASSAILKIEFQLLSNFRILRRDIPSVLLFFPFFKNNLINKLVIF